MRQIEQIIKKVFHRYCQQMMVEHPLLESALAQIIDVEEEAAKKEKLARSSTHHAGSLGTGGVSATGKGLLRSFNTQSSNYRR